MKKLIVFFTGAGISEKSGIGTYRDENGIDIKGNSGINLEEYKKDREGSIKKLKEIKKRIHSSMPNEAHHLIRELEDDYSVVVVTQNIDDLHEMAGSTRVIHLHGEINATKKDEDGFERPDIVMFGEEIKNWDIATLAAGKCDYFIAVGTSLMVEPACSIIEYPRKKKFLVNKGNPTNVDGFEYYNEDAFEGIKKVIEEIKKMG